MKHTLLLLSLLLFSYHSFGINLNKFQFSNSPTFVTLEDGLLTNGIVTTDYKYIVVLSYTYARAPFIELNGNERTKTIIDWMHTMTYGGAYRFNDSFQMGFSSYWTYIRAIGIDEDDYEIKTLPGDSILDVKWKLFEKNRFAISLTPKLFLPTGKEKYYTSNDEVGYYLGFAFDKAFSLFQIAVNIGHKENSGARYLNVDHRRQFYTSLGVLIPLTNALDLTAETYRETPYNNSNDQAPSEASLGIRYGFSKEYALFTGVGAGAVGDEENSTDYRLFAGIKYYPRARKLNKKIQYEERKFGKYYQSYNVYFPTGVDKVDKSYNAKFQYFIDSVNADPYVSKIIIEGYASRIGAKKLNRTLSRKRAKNVKRYLLAKGVKNQRIHLISYGNTRSDKVEVNKSRDRKAVIRVYRSR